MRGLHRQRAYGPDAPGSGPIAQGAEVSAPWHDTSSCVTGLRPTAETHRCDSDQRRSKIAALR
jgi:hypothetical protein